MSWEVEEAESALHASCSRDFPDGGSYREEKTLIAPFAARIGLCNTHVGQFLPSGSQIVSLQSIEGFVNVDFMVPQSAADFIGIDNAVELVDESGSYTARISAIDSQADRSTRNLMVRAKLEPVPKQLLAG